MLASRALTSINDFLSSLTDAQRRVIAFRLFLGTLGVGFIIVSNSGLLIIRFLLNFIRHSALTRTSVFLLRQANTLLTFAFVNLRKAIAFTSQVMFVYFSRTQQAALITGSLATGIRFLTFALNPLNLVLGGFIASMLVIERLLPNVFNFITRSYRRLQNILLNLPFIAFSAARSLVNIGRALFSRDLPRAFNGFISFFDDLEETSSSALNSVADSVRNVFSEIGRIISDTFDLFPDITGDLGQATSSAEISRSAEQAVDSVRGAFRSGFAEAISGGDVNEALFNIADAFSMRILDNLADNLFRVFDQALEGFFQDIFEGFDKVGDTLVNAANSIFSAASNFIGTSTLDALAASAGTLGGVSGAIAPTSLFNTRAVNEIASATSTGVSGGLANFFSGAFQEGGFIPRGRFGIVGEAGPELVTGPSLITPLEDTGNISITLNVTGNVDDATRRAVLEMGQEVTEIVQRNLEDRGVL